MSSEQEKTLLWIADEKFWHCCKRSNISPWKSLKHGADVDGNEEYVKILILITGSAFVK